MTTRELDGHSWQWRDGRVVHLASCPCWGQDLETVAAIRGRWASVVPGDATVPPGNRRYRGAAWRRWLGL